MSYEVTKGETAGPRTHTCRVCGKAVTFKEMSTLGARCEPCYEQYRRSGPCGTGDGVKRASSVREALSRLAQQSDLSPAEKVAANIRRIVSERGGVISRVQQEMLASCDKVIHGRQERADYDDSGIE